MSIALHERLSDESFFPKTFRISPAVKEGIDNYDLKWKRFIGFSSKEAQLLSAPGWLDEWQSTLPESTKLTQKDFEAKILPYEVVYGVNKNAQDKPILVYHSGAWESAQSLAYMVKHILDTNEFYAVIIHDSALSRRITGEHFPPNFPNKKQQGLQMAALTMDVVNEIMKNDAPEVKRRLISAGISLGGDAQVFPALYYDAFQKALFVKPELSGLIFQHAARIDAQNPALFGLRVLQGSKWIKETWLMIDKLAKDTTNDPLKDITDILSDIPDEGQKNYIRMLLSEYHNTSSQTDRDILKQQINEIIEPFKDAKAHTFVENVLKSIHGNKAELEEYIASINIDPKLRERFEDIRATLKYYTDAPQGTEKEFARKKLFKLLQPVVAQIPGDLHNWDKKFYLSCWLWATRIWSMLTPLEEDIAAAFKCPVGVIAGEDDLYFKAARMSKFLDRHGGLKALFPKSTKRRFKSLKNAPHIIDYTDPLDGLIRGLIPMANELLNGNVAQETSGGYFWLFLRKLNSFLHLKKPPRIKKARIF